MYCRWKASWWIEQQFARVQQLPEEDVIHEGLEAYAKQQASYELQLAGVWETRWLPVQQWAKLILQQVVGDPTGEAVIVVLDDEEIKQGQGLKYD